MRRPFALFATAVALLSCDSSSNGEGGNGNAGGSGGNGGSAGSDAGAESCKGVSKGPWTLAVNDSAATVRWEACRDDTSAELTLATEAGAVVGTRTANVRATEVTETHDAPFAPDLPKDEAGTYWMHEAKLDGLEPGTCYLATLSEDSTRSARFCTSPPSGKSFRFFAIGDTNPGLGKGTMELLGHAAKRGFDFTVHAGDLQYYSSALETWASWFDWMRPMLEQGAFYPAVGNHESEKDNEFDEYFVRLFGGAGFGGTDTYYSFEHGGVAFFTLDTEQSIGAGTNQYGWFEQRLKEAAAKPGYRFGVVWLHRTFVTCGDAGNMPAERSLYEPLFEQYGVQLVLQGHMHGYERFEIDTAGGGHVTYVTTAGGGGLLGDPSENTDRPECASRESVGGFVHGTLIDVTETGFSGTVIDHEGTVRDEFTRTL